MTPPIDPVLVVEDSDLFREAICRLLAERNLDVVEARDSQEAWEYLERGGRTSCIVLDLALPRMDGRAFRAKLLDHEHYARIPVVVFTGTAEEMHDVVAVVRKTDCDALLDTVERVVRRLKP